MPRNDLDRILGGETNADTGPQNASSTIAAVTDMSWVDGAVVATIQRTDVLTGGVTSELARLDPKGHRRASLMLNAPADTTDQAIAYAMVGQNGPCLLHLTGADLLALTPAAAPLSNVINGLGLGRIDLLVQSSDWCAVYGVTAADDPVLYAISGETPVGLPLDPLALSDTRQLNNIQIIGDTLYAAVVDSISGFDIYHCALGNGPAAFELVLTKGARRFAINAAVSGMMPCEQGLLIGTAALANPSHPLGDWGPELLLITQSGSWDLIAGQPRFSPEGLLLPAASQMAGMGHTGNAAIRGMAQHGTSVVIAVQEFSGSPHEDRRTVALDLSEYSGAVRLYLSSNLEDWKQIPHRLPSDIGAVSSLCMTQNSIYVGHEGLGPDVVPVHVVALGD
ncbi:MAG: hypothetical protein P1U83_06570 [Roseovarius sp.]|nr:hypothetical protein [Roseovarius sp.]